MCSSDLLPGFLNAKTGKLSGYTMGWGGRVGLPKGSWLITGNEKYVVHSGDLFDMTRPNDERFQNARRSEERREGKECRSRWSPAQ